MLHTLTKDALLNNCIGHNVGEKIASGQLNNKMMGGADSDNLFIFIICLLPLKVYSEERKLKILSANVINLLHAPFAGHSVLTPGYTCFRYHKSN